MILLYHSIIPDNSPIERSCVGQAIPQSVFEKHIRWLARHYTIVPLAEYLSALKKTNFRNKRLIAITFDDGFGYTYQCISPFLTANNVPVTIFVSTGHLEHGELLWFSYLKAICFENIYKLIKMNRDTFPLQTITQRKKTWRQLHSLAKTSGNPSSFCRILSKKYPLSSDISILYEGMTYDQIRASGNDPVIELGAHTITHPYLDLISKEDQGREILESKKILSELTGKTIRYFAYPGGEYNHETLNLVKASGYEAALAVISKKLGDDSCFEINRIGVYSQSLFKLQMKTLGLADFARAAGIRVG